MKKNWHTQTLTNIERVWKAEQKREDELRKIEQLKKELEQERRIEELRKLQEDAGLIKKRGERVEWMYGSAHGAPKDVQEDFLLGKRRVDDKKPAPLLEEAAAAAAEKSGDGPFLDPRDLERKIREDPLMMIKRKEKQTVMDIVENPLKMKQLRELNEKLKKEKKSKKKHKHKHEHREHRSKEDRKDERDKHESSSSSSKDRHEKNESSSSKDRRDKYESSSSSSSSSNTTSTYRSLNNSRARLTEEEKAARLAAMQQDAEWSKKDRDERIRLGVELDKIKDGTTQYSGNAKFLNKMKTDAYFGEIGRAHV